MLTKATTVNPAEAHIRVMLEKRKYSMPTTTTKSYHISSNKKNPCSKISSFAYTSNRAESKETQPANENQP
jgi:hypothetical protein